MNVASDSAVPGPDHFAVISDVHGNVDALRAVLRDIECQGIRTILNLGDHFSGPLAAQETAELLCSYDMISIRGNHDRWLVEVAPELQSGSEAAAFVQLSAAHLDWLRALPATRMLGNVLMCHGTPDSDTTYLSESVSPDRTLVLDHPTEIARRIGATKARLILCGHSHVARRIDLPDGRTILNPGSVGCPGYESVDPAPHTVQAGSPAASYATVRRQGSGWLTAICTVEYETWRMVARARSSIRPGWVSILETGWLKSSFYQCCQKSDTFDPRSV